MKKLLLVLLLLAPSAHAAFTFRDGWVKVSVGTSQPNAVSCGSQCQRIWTYSNGVLLHLPASDVESISGPGITGKTVVTELIQVTGTLTIDPRVGVPADVPPSHRTTSYPPGKYGLYVIQFIGPVDDAMLNGVTATGALVDTFYAQLRYNAYVIRATPEMFETIRALPQIQYADFLHPYQKPLFGYQPQLPPVFYDYEVELLPAPDSAQARAEIAEYAVVPANYTFGRFVFSPVRIRAEDIPRLYTNRLVRSATPMMSPVSRPQFMAVFPRRAPVGTMVTISGGHMDNITSIDFDGVPVTEWSATTDGRIRARVPAIPPGLHALHGRTAESEQLLPNVFTADSTTSRTTMAPGDIFDLGIVPGLYPACCPEMKVEWLDPNGFMNQRWRPDGLADTIFFDPQGFLNVVTFNSVKRYDAKAEPAGDGPAWLQNAKMVLYDRDGNAVVFRQRNILYYTGTGTLIRTIATPDLFPSQGDLAADQCTLYVSAGPAIRTYNVCTGATLANVPVASRAVRVLPDGNLLVLQETNIVVARPDGTIVRSVPHGQAHPQMAITPDATTAMIIGEKVQAYDLTNGTLRLLRPEREFGNTGVLAIYGGWTAARGAEAYAVDPAIQNVAGVDGPAGSTATINGSGFRPGARVLVNGVEATVTNVTPTQITFVIPAGTTSPRTITVINPNGQNVVFGSNVPSSHVHAVPALDWRGLVVMGLLLAVAGMVFLRQ